MVTGSYGITDSVCSSELLKSEPMNLRFYRNLSELLFLEEGTVPKKCDSILASPDKCGERKAQTQFTSLPISSRCILFVGCLTERERERDGPSTGEFRQG